MKVKPNPKKLRPTLDNEVSCPLMDLTPELRNDCYRSALVADEPVPLKRRDILGRRPLLNTCTQIRNEATSIFWAQNTFIMDVRDLGQACHALSHVRLEHCTLITRLIVRFQVDVEPPVAPLPWCLRGTPPRAGS
ncbi:hypothetical protein LTR09_010843 [Extremus antarcticus]|uniref:Uncharacterized protein n=1 Tax=Extremus antarcticus TaxID=702011 RepID=A0AAJ0G5B6_9PEZI|nr:hypothetical protein LTR09_010843 [Extremus antarcticus]